MMFFWAFLVALVSAAVADTFADLVADNWRLFLQNMANKDLDTDWKMYKADHKKNYLSEESLKRLVWEKNMEDIGKHNLENLLGLQSFKMGSNKYADLMPSTLNIWTTIVNSLSPSVKSKKASLQSVDWRSDGYVTGVKDQGQCGSCWSFSATGALEGQMFKKTGKLVSLSEQNLVDCSSSYGNDGCNGGLMDDAFRYVKDNGIMNQTAYPYKAVVGTCAYKASKVAATCTGFRDLQSGSESALKEAVTTVGPISVAIDASSQKFQLYSGGIYYNPSCSSTALDHGVLVVGFGTDNNNQDYWIVKNSWGTSWGENGYIRMSRNKNNQCGIATLASYPTV